MKSCFLQGHGTCSPGLTGEHYISATVLEAVAKDSVVKIGGLRWQPNDTLQSMPIPRLISNILCETHNKGLSPLDNEAGKLFRAIDAVDKAATSLPATTSVDGSIIERWFVKVLCGLAASSGFNNGQIPEEWKRILWAGAWPVHWGMYFPVPLGPCVLASELSIETHVHPETRLILAATFRAMGVGFHVLLGHPDIPSSWGIRRARGMIFRDGSLEKRIEFKWPLVTDTAVIYTKAGTTRERPPQWDGWKE
jgi:hypothetical protein